MCAWGCTPGRLDWTASGDEIRRLAHQEPRCTDADVPPRTGGGSSALAGNAPAWLVRKLPEGVSALKDLDERRLKGMATLGRHLYQACAARAGNGSFPHSCDWCDSP